MGNSIFSFGFAHVSEVRHIIVNEFKIVKMIEYNLNIPEKI